MISDFLKSQTQYFDSFETREEAFNQSVSHLIPCKYKGPQRFWQEFNQIIRERLPQIKKQTTAYITSAPRDCLAFGTTRQVLAAARLSAVSQNNQKVASIEEIAAEFDLLDSLNQPIRTLSGGETVKLALAKTLLQIAFSQRLSIASPFCWLSRQNIHLLEKVAKTYQDQNLPVKIYALENEDNFNPISHLASAARLHQGPIFDLETQNVRLRLGTAVTEIGVPSKTAAISDVKMRLVSPCLIHGDNGQGKSLLAKALSGAIKIQGRLFVGGKNRSIRLLFQDVINQTLLRSFQSLARSQRCAKDNDVSHIYQSIWRYYRSILDDKSITVPNNFNATIPHLISIKILLVAVRLCGRPEALILDEPDWGLTRKSAEAFVLAVVHCAHELEVSILIISHKPWWRELAYSRLIVRKIPQASEPDNPCRFMITLEQKS
jgi:ABC-type multidrug transport system ATPase subunit